MQNNMQIWLESSTTTFNLNSHDEGVYLVSDLDGLTSLPEIRTSQGVNAGTDGGWTSAQAFDARLISLNIVIANEDESIVESKRRTLNSLLAQSRKESLKLHFISEAGMEYVISVRVTNVSGALSNILKKQNLLIQMRADDPIIYGAQGGEGADATLTVQQAQGGFEIPFDIPLIIDGGTDKVNVENLGSEEVYPVIKMTGPLHNPTVVNETQNAEIGVNADLGDMEWRGYESAELYGNATQETLSGKNLLFIPNGTYSSSSVLWTITDSTITASGTSNGNWSYLFNTQTFATPLQAGNYTFSIPQALPYTFQIVITDENNTTHDYNIQVGDMSATININYVATKYRLVYRVSNQQISLSMPNKLQLESGSSATDFEQYCGGVPSPNPSYPQTVNVVSGAQMVKITGKNLWGIASEYDRSQSAVDFKTMPDGSIEASGTATGTAYSLTATEALNNVQWVYLTAGTYTLSIDETLPSGVIVMIIDIDTNTQIGPSLDTAHSSRTYTLNKNYKALIRLRISSGTTVDATFKPMLVEGSTPKPYEPHQETKYLITLNVGANKLDPNMIDGYVNNDGSMASPHPNGEQHSEFISVKPNTQYTFEIFETTGTATDWIGIGEYKKSGIGTFIQRDVQTSQKYYTFTTTANTNYVVVSARNLATATKVMFSEGGRTTYEAYTPLELAKIGTYQDYIYKSGDKWYIHKEIGKQTISSSTNIILASSYTNIEYGQVAKPTDAVFYGNNDPSKGATLASFATYGLVPGTNYDNAQNIGRYIIQASSTRYFVGFAKGTGIDAIKATLTGGVLYYALATPTETQITDDALIGQLEALLNYAPWYGDDQNVFLIPSGGAQGELIIGAHNEPKPADVVLIDTQLKTVTLNGENAYPLLKDGSSFFTLAPGDNTMYLTSDVSSDTGKAEIKFKQGFISI